MNKFKNFICAAIVACLFIPTIVSCASKYDSKKDIIVLYTNDVHCGIDKNLGYAGLVNYKKEMLALTPNVTLVDVGDAIQGEAIGTVSRGSYIVDIMNKVGYEFAILGNHEFDYGMERISELIKKSKATYLASNITYVGNKSNLLGKTKPYAIVNYGGTKVAFIGVSTPESVVKSTPKYFMEDDKIVYNFTSGKDLYDGVQKTVNEVRAKGAKYVVVLGHLGIDEESNPNRSSDLIANTVGIDVFLDGHSHSTVASSIIKNRAGNGVYYSQTGTKLAAIGKLTITPEGRISTGLITKTEKDADTTQFIETIKSQYEGELKKVVASSEVDLLSTADGVRAVRNRETALGDFCADAYRAVTGADIAFVNGGGIRADLKKGDLTIEDMIKVHPYGNMLCMVETTGQNILDALELSCNAVMKDAKDSNGKAVGESGGFVQVSGIRFTVDTSIPTSVVRDSKGFFKSVSGRRRVSNVMVEKDGLWTPINPEKKYTLASHNYLLQDQGDGYTMFKDGNYKIDKAMLDNQVIITYIRDHLGGVIKSKDYSSPKGRITIK